MTLSMILGGLAAKAFEGSSYREECSLTQVSNVLDYNFVTTS